MTTLLALAILITTTSLSIGTNTNQSFSLSGTVLQGYLRAPLSTTSWLREEVFVYNFSGDRPFPGLGGGAFGFSLVA